MSDWWRAIGRNHWVSGDPRVRSTANRHRRIACGTAADRPILHQKFLGGDEASGCRYAGSDGFRGQDLSFREAVMARLSACLFVLVTSVHCLAQDADPVPQPDSVQKAISALKADFVSACKTADGGVIDAIEDELAAARDDGNFDLTRRIEAAKDAFLQRNLLPTDALLSAARRDYDRQYLAAKQACLDGFEEIVAARTRAGDSARAEAVRAEKKRWERRLGVRKTPTTRFVASPPPDAQMWEGSGHFYRIIRVKDQKIGIGWNEAKKTCEEMGGYLACGETPAEIHYLKGLSPRAWTGGYRDHTGKWLWVSGATMTDRPGAESKEAAYASTDPNGLLARPEDGIRAKGVVGFICEWDD